MRFPVTFKRQKGGASSDPAIGSDVAPTAAGTAGPGKQDNLLTAAISDINGWPIQRVAVCWSTTGTNPVALNGNLYFWEETTGRWYLINDAALSLKPNQLFFFDVPTIVTPRATDANIRGGVGATCGALEVLLVLADPGAAVNGVYTIAMGADITTVGT